VITTTFTFYATVGAIVATGAKPVFVDSDDGFMIAADKIEEAILTVRPMGVDVASGVESAPGVKDLEKVARFLANAQSAFARMVNP